jgi:hypothetical protein
MATNFLLWAEEVNINTQDFEGNASIHHVRLEDHGSFPYLQV